MNRLKNMGLLRGQSETISITDFRKSPGEVLTQVELGKTFTITRNGHAIAVISLPEPTALELGAAVRRLGLVK